MSVKLDWEFDDDDAPLPEQQPEASRPGGCRRWWRFLLIVALILAAASGVLWYRVRQKDKEREAELRAVVELELVAFVEGDRDLFLNQQDPDDGPWRRVQQETFERYHSGRQTSPWGRAPQIATYTGTVASLDVEGEAGHALVQLAQGEDTWHELWFYRRTRSEGWRHVRFDEDWLGEQQRLATLHFYFIYHERDKAIVHALAHEFERYYDLLAPLLGTGTSNTPLMTVEFIYHAPTRTSPTEFRWRNRYPFTLEAPSPHQGPLTSEKAPSPQLRRQMARYLVEALIAHGAVLHPNDTLPVEIDALRRALRDWSLARLAADMQESWSLPPTPLIDALVAREGVQVVSRLIASLEDAETLDQALATAGLDPPDPLARFAFLVVTAERAFQALDEEGYFDLLDREAGRDWRRYYYNRFRQRRASVDAGTSWPVLSSLQVTSIAFNGDVAWVEVETERDGVRYRQTRFFRQVGDRWLLTSPDPAYFGERRVTRTQNLAFEYFEPDAYWFENRIPTELQAVLSQAAQDLGFAQDGLVFTITTVLQPDVAGLSSGDPSTLQWTSPLVVGWPLERLDQQVSQMFFPMFITMFESRTQGFSEQNPNRFLVYVGTFVWELERLFPDAFDLETWTGLDLDRVPLRSLAEMWSSAGAETDEAEMEQIFGTYRALITFLADTYGPEVVPALLDNLVQTEDLDEWLRLSTGHGLEEIQPAWQTWISEDF